MDRERDQPSQDFEDASFDDADLVDTIHLSHPPPLSEMPTAAYAESSEIVDPPTLSGRKIRQFRILESLGEGGMGDVYRGVDETLNRKVALKALRAEHRLRPEAKARLLREARILSQLDHPHICRIYDFVEEGETDLLVLELIEGRNLRSLMKEESLSPTRRMEIACQMADVLVAAHNHGIVHRDLKPENVMIAHGGDVKVLDFGIARSLQEGDSSTRPDHYSSGSSAATVVQDAEDGVITGTIAYMSPEQARGETSSAASDMYSFGLLLQELFTGRRAYESINPAKLIADVSQAKTLPADGIDLDLAETIERLKAFEPAARPAAIDVADRLRWIQNKPRRRRKNQLTIAAMVFLALMSTAMAFLAYRIGQEADRAAEASERAQQEAQRANQEAKRASQEAQRANQEADAALEVSQFLVGLFEISDPYAPNAADTREELTALELLEQGARKIDELEGQPLTQARLMDTMGDVYYKIGDTERSFDLHERTLALRDAHLPNDHPDIARTLRRLANIHRLQTRFADAEPLYRRSLEILGNGEDQVELADALTEIGTFYWYQGRSQEAGDLLRRAETVFREVGGSDRQVASAYQALGFINQQNGNLEEARKLFRETIELQERALGPDHPNLSFTLNGLGLVEHDLAHFKQAEELLRKGLRIREAALGRDHPMVGWLLNGLGTLYVDLGRWDDAEKVLQRAYRMPADPPNRSLTRLGLARLSSERGQDAEAEALFAEAREIWETSFGADHLDLAAVLLSEADHWLRRERLDEAEQLLERALDLREKAGEQKMLIDALNSHGELLIARASIAEARAQFERALNAARRILRAGHPAEARALHGLGEAARLEGRFEEAEQHFRLALGLREEAFEPDHPLVALSRAGLERLP